MTFDEIYNAISGLAVLSGSAFASADDCTADLHITGSDGGVIGAAIRSGKLTVQNGSTGSPEATVSISADDFAALINGQLNPMMAMMTGRIKVSGNYAKLMSLMKGLKR